MFKRRLMAWMGLWLAMAPALAADAIDRIEPPSWWVGMRHPQLQLMVHGDRIAEFTPAVRHPGVRLLSTTRTANPNYLFIDLEILPGAAPGSVDLSFRRGSTVLHRAYPLQARAPGSVERQGFGPRDAILNLVPDRFANGDPRNDDLPGFLDKSHRADDAAGRHGGDLQGIANHLDYIAGMGYTMLWPTPLVENNQPKYSYHGYAATDLYKIDARFGSNDDYRRLIAQARAKGIGVIQDIVLNHIGSNHWWMQDLPAPDWLTHEGRFVPTMHARTAVSDAYASQADRDDFTQGWFTDHMPDLNQKNPLLATYLIQNSIWWVEWAGLSGIREDTYGYSDTAFLAEWSRRVMQEYPRFNIVGEEWSGNPVVVSYWLRGRANPDGYVSHTPSMMDFPLHETLRRALAAEEGMFSGFNELYAALVNDRLYPEPSHMVLFEGNHDVPRLWSVLGEDLALWKMAMVYVATMPRTPQFYYGSEVLMTSPTQRDDGATRRDFPGGWAGDKVNAVTGEGLSAQQKEAQAFLRRLLTWRKSQPVIHQGRLMHYAPQDGSYVYFRYEGDRKVMVAMNKGRAAAALDTSRFHEMLAGHASGTDVFSGQRVLLRPTLSLPPRSVTVLELQ
jgi:glycosidase